MEAVVPIIEEPQKLDLLDRQEFVDRMLTIAKALSNNKKNACYAVNGDWGVGKSFVLDMFEEQAKDIGVEGETLSRYLLFRYNCWEYDYYEEPLVAIVASILDQIDEKAKLLSSDVKDKIIAILKVVGRGLVIKAAEVIKEKTNIDVSEVVKIIKEGGEEAKKRIEDSHGYDQFFDFKKSLENLRETITFLSKDQTVVFIVDELDRCLPEYTIKVLERLHHLFNEIPNVQVILSIDASQIEHIVRQIYGEGTDAKKYLRKFIQFELKLDEGIIKDHFDERFKEYSQLFEVKNSTTREIDVDDFKHFILNGLDMRSRIAIIERCELLHKMLAEEESLDSSYMCLEMLLVILGDLKINIDHAKRSFNNLSVFSPEALWPSSSKKAIPQGLHNLSELFRTNKNPDNNAFKLFSFNREDQRYWVNVDCLLGALLSAYRWILGFNEDRWFNTPYYNHAFVDYAKKYWEILQIVS